MVEAIERKGVQIVSDLALSVSSAKIQSIMLKNFWSAWRRRLRILVESSEIFKILSFQPPIGHFVPPIDHEFAP